MKGGITRGKCSPFVAFWCKRGPLAGRGGFAGVEKGLGGIGREREREDGRWKVWGWARHQVNQANCFTAISILVILTLVCFDIAKMSWNHRWPWNPFFGRETQLGGPSAVRLWILGFSNNQIREGIHWSWSPYGGNYFSSYLAVKFEIKLSACITLKWQTWMTICDEDTSNLKRNFTLGTNVHQVGIFCW